MVVIYLRGKAQEDLGTEVPSGPNRGQSPWWGSRGDEAPAAEEKNHILHANFHCRCIEKSPFARKFAQ